MSRIFYVALGGMVGAVLRYGVYLVSEQYLGDFDRLWATLFVNVVGSFVLGCLFAYSQGWSVDQRLSLLLMVGLLGSFTTFSTFALESVELLLADRLLALGWYIVGSNVASFAAAWGGIVLVRNVAP